MPGPFHQLVSTKKGRKSCRSQPSRPSPPVPAPTVSVATTGSPVATTGSPAAETTGDRRYFFTSFLHLREIVHRLTPEPTNLPHSNYPRTMPITIRGIPPADSDRSGASVPVRQRIGDPVAQYLGERSTLEISGSGVWAGRPRPCYRSSSFLSPSGGRRRRKLSVAPGSVLSARGGSWTCFLLLHQAK